MDTLTLPPPLVGAPGLGANDGSASVDGAGVRRRRRPDALALGLALLVMLAAILAALAIALLLRSGGASPPDRYRTETVTRGQVTGVLRVPARVVPRNVIRVGSERVGRMMSVAVSPGDRVKRGQVLARMDDREVRALAIGARAAALAAQVNQHQAEMRLAQIVYLMQNGGAEDSSGEPLSAVELRSAALDAEVTLVNAAAELKKQAAAVTASQAVLAGTILTAPIDGVVLSRAVEPGETVTAGTPLFVIATDPSEMQVVASLGAGDVSRVRPGRVTFIVPAVPDHVFQANVGAIEPALRAPGDEGSGTPGYHVRLAAPNREMQLRPGMTATVSLPLASAREALQVPVEALQFNLDGGADLRSAIYVLDAAKKPLRVPVEVGVTDGRVVEVRGAALQPGASVILGSTGHRVD
jgi:HlyD family secretion protein